MLHQQLHGRMLAVGCCPVHWCTFQQWAGSMRTAVHQQLKHINLPALSCMADSKAYILRRDCWVPYHQLENCLMPTAASLPKRDPHG
jgi:hypothetical protein